MGTASNEGGGSVRAEEGAAQWLTSIALRKATKRNDQGTVRKRWLRGLKRSASVAKPPTHETLEERYEGARTLFFYNAEVHTTHTEDTTARLALSVLTVGRPLVPSRAA